ncbi:hypothetical protein GCM10025762_33350 [Haloechinothrix salitolerans]
MNSATVNGVETPDSVAIGNISSVAPSAIASANPTNKAREGCARRRVAARPRRSRRRGCNRGESVAVMTTRNLQPTVSCRM